jgi:hypothetical protein
MPVQSRTAEVLIYTGDHLDRIRHVEQKYDAALAAYERAVKAEADMPRRVGTKPESAALDEERQRLADEHAALVEKAEETAIRVNVGTVRRSVYRGLADEHPPREDHKGDGALGVNVLTFREALVPASIIDVTEDGKTRAWGDIPAAEREEFLDTLAESDFERLFGQAYGLVNGFATGPKALTLPDSSETSRSAAS